MKANRNLITEKEQRTEVSRLRQGYGGQECQRSEVNEHLPHNGCSSSRKLCGLLVLKERWGLSWRGVMLALVVSGGLAISAFLSVYPFLAITQRVNTNVLVVEGWVHKYAIRSAVEEFRRGSYQRVFTTGGPVIGNGGYVNDYQTSAGVGADLLKKFGVPTEVVQMVPSHVIGRDRTYSAAVALRDWLQENDISVRNFNIVTEDFHARRTRLLYQKAFGKDVVIGIIAVPSPDYDADHWWRYSDGVREAVGESIAYLYAKLFFFPSGSARPKKAMGVDIWEVIEAAKTKPFGFMPF